VPTTKRGWVIPFAAAAVAVVIEPPQLIRLAGTVGYALDAGDPLRPLADRLDLGVGGYAVTLADSQAELDFADGTTIAVGEHAALNVVTTTVDTTTIELVRGALHVRVRATSRIAVLTPTGGVALSDADAFVVAGPLGTEVACVRCARTTVVAGASGHAQLGSCVVGDATPKSVTAGGAVNVDNPAMDALAGGTDALDGCRPRPRVRVDPTASNPGAHDVLAHGWGTFTAGALFAVLVMLGARGG
jgi:hypothetical protein